MKTADFDYELPAGLIAQQPLAERDAARMLVLDPAEDRLIHSKVRELPHFLRSGDLLVVNDTRVLPARLHGEREGGGEAEVLLLRPIDEDGRWEALLRPGRRLPAGARIIFPGSALTVAVEANGGETALVLLAGVEDPLAEVRRFGEMPTPPYIKRRLEDSERYQTVFSRREGSAAAPTAGLHFTPALLDAISAAGVERCTVTLHVGLDTFRPVRVEDPRQHRIHREWFEVDAGAARAVNRTRERGGRVVAVGTTCVRVLETVAEGDRIRAARGWSELLILPGHRFRVVDSMLTNFHLPQSTLLMLVSAFAGRERILLAYAEAVTRGLPLLQLWRLHVHHRARRSRELSAAGNRGSQPAWPAADGPRDRSRRPAFMPVGTLAYRQGADARRGRSSRCPGPAGQHLSPGAASGRRPDRAPGRAASLHGLGRSAILTDSGGFQVFSLDHMVRVSDEAAVFRSHLDGSQHRFTPESVMDLQRALRFAMSRWHSTSPRPGRVTGAPTTAAPSERTHRWAERCLAAPAGDRASCDSGSRRAASRKTFAWRAHGC